MEIKQILDHVDQLKNEIDKLRPIDPEQESRIMQKFRLEWTFHSNAIEGNTLTFGETKAFLLHGVTAQGKPFRDYLDIKGHHEAVDDLLTIVRQQKPLTEADIRELHRIILVEPYEVDAMTPDGRPAKRRVRPGQYKTMPNHVRTSTGNIHYYASPEETPAKMGDLMDWYRRELDKGQVHPLVLAATFHYQFVTIHPFDDGNGRMARLLMNLILMQAGFPPVIVRNDAKDTYLLALEKADEDNDLEPFISLVGEALTRSLDLYLRGAKGENIEEFDDLDKKLALLHKKLEVEETARPEKNPVILLNFSNTFLEPFLSRLFTQLAKFDHFFSRNFFRLTYYREEEPRKKVYFNSPSALHSITNTIKKTIGVSSIYIVYEWSDFISDNRFHLLFTLDIDLRRYGYEISWLTHNYQSDYTRFTVYNEDDDWDAMQSLNDIQREKEKILITGRYDIIFSEEEIQKPVQIVTDEIYKVLEQKTGN
jgi:Fic family protein